MDEQQQKLINGIQKAAHEAVIAAHAEKKLFKENIPEHKKIRAFESLKGYENKLRSLQTAAEDSGISNDDVSSAIEKEQYRTKEAIKSGKLDSEIAQMKSAISEINPKDIIPERPKLAPTESKAVATKLTPAELAWTQELKQAILPDQIRWHVGRKLNQEANEAAGKSTSSTSNLVSTSPVINNLLSKSNEYYDVVNKINQSIGNPEIFNKLFAQAQAEIATEIKDGKHNEAINLLADEIYNKESARLKENAGDTPDKLIRKSRELFQKITSGNGGSPELLAKKLGELEKYHGLGAKILDPNFDLNHPEKPHKTNEQMKVVMAISIEKGVALYEARKDIDRMASGEYDVKRSIESINKHLFSVSMGYDALDKAFDPNNPDAPHKTVQEMKDVIKAAAKNGNEAREALILAEQKSIEKSGKMVNPNLPRRYTKPDYNLDIDKLLSVEVRKTSSLSSDDNKFAAMMEGVKVSQLISVNTTSFIPSLPRNGSSHAIV